MFQFTSFPSLRLYIHLRIPTHYCRWVPPFGYLRIIGYLLLPAAFRSLSRPSSAPSAKASALCSFSLDLLLVFFLCYCVVAHSSLSCVPLYAPSLFIRTPCISEKILRSPIHSSVSVYRLLYYSLITHSENLSGFSVEALFQISDLVKGLMQPNSKIFDFVFDC